MSFALFNKKSTARFQVGLIDDSDDDDFLEPLVKVKKKRGLKLSGSTLLCPQRSYRPDPQKPDDTSTPSPSRDSFTELKKSKKQRTHGNTVSNSIYVAPKNISSQRENDFDLKKKDEAASEESIVADDDRSSSAPHTLQQQLSQRKGIIHKRNSSSRSLSLPRHPHSAPLTLSTTSPPFSSPSSHRSGESGAGLDSISISTSQTPIPSTTSILSNKQQNPCPSSSPIPSPMSLQQWMCLTCTLYNYDHCSVCAMCETPRYPTSNRTGKVTDVSSPLLSTHSHDAPIAIDRSSYDMSIPHSSSEDHHQKPVNNAYIVDNEGEKSLEIPCPKCTFLNKCDAVNCEICNRPLAKKQTRSHKQPVISNTRKKNSTTSIPQNEISDRVEKEGRAEKRRKTVATEPSEARVGRPWQISKTLLNDGDDGRLDEQSGNNSDGVGNDRLRSSKEKVSNVLNNDLRSTMSRHTCVSLEEKEIGIKAKARSRSKCCDESEVDVTASYGVGVTGVTDCGLPHAEVIRSGEVTRGPWSPPPSSSDEEDDDEVVEKVERGPWSPPPSSSDEEDDDEVVEKIERGPWSPPPSSSDEEDGEEEVGENRGSGNVREGRNGGAVAVAPVVDLTELRVDVSNSQRPSGGDILHGKKLDSLGDSGTDLSDTDDEGLRQAMVENKHERLFTHMTHTMNKTPVKSKNNFNTEGASKTPVRISDSDEDEEDGEGKAVDDMWDYESDESDVDEDTENSFEFLDRSSLPTGAHWRPSDDGEYDDIADFEDDDDDCARGDQCSHPLIADHFTCVKDLKRSGKCSVDFNLFILKSTCMRQSNTYESRLTARENKKKSKAKKRATRRKVTKRRSWKKKK